MSSKSNMTRRLSQVDKWHLCYMAAAGWNIWTSLYLTWIQLGFHKVHKFHWGCCLGTLKQSPPHNPKHCQQMVLLLESTVIIQGWWLTASVSSDTAKKAFSSIYFCVLVSFPKIQSEKKCGPDITGFTPPSKRSKTLTLSTFYMAAMDWCKHRNMSAP